MKEDGLQDFQTYAQFIAGSVILGVVLIGVIVATGLALLQLFGRR